MQKLVSFAPSSLFILWWAWIVSVAVASSDFSIPTMNFGVRLLISGNILSNINRIRLCSGHFGCFTVASSFNSPSLRMFYNMLIFAFCNNYASLYLVRIPGLIRQSPVSSFCIKPRFWVLYFSARCLSRLISC